MIEQDKYVLRGKIKSINIKSILLILEDNDEIWFPLSTIKGRFDENNKGFQDFQVKPWIINRRLKSSDEALKLKKLRDDIGNMRNREHENNLKEMELYLEEKKPTLDEIIKNSGYFIENESIRKFIISEGAEIVETGAVDVLIEQLIIRAKLVLDIANLRWYEDGRFFLKGIFIKNAVETVKTMTIEELLELKSEIEAKKNEISEYNQKKVRIATSKYG